MNKLTLLHINIIGAVVVLIVAGALWFTIISSAQDGIKTAQGEFDGVNGRFQQLGAHQKERDNAKKAREVAIKEYAINEARYMPRFGYTTNRFKDMMSVWWPNRGRSWPERFIHGVRTFMAQEARRNGIRWDNPEILALPSYGPDPNTIDMGDDGTWRSPVYQITVTGRNYPLLMRHIQDWNSLHGLGMPVVDNVTLAGNSPNLQASYSVQFTAILYNTEKPAAKMPRISGSGSGGGGGGGGAAFGGAGAMGGGGMRGGGGPQGSAGMSMGAGRKGAE